MVSVFLSPSKYIRHAKREFLGIRFSKNLHLPKTERRVEVREWLGMEEERMQSLRKTVGDFDCGRYEPNGKRLFQANDTKLLASAIRNEILASLLVDKRVSDSPSSSYTNRSWIEEGMKYFESNQ